MRRHDKEPHSKQTIRQLAALNRIGQVVTSNLALEQVLQRILDEVPQLVGAEGVAVFLPVSQDELEIVALSGSGAAPLHGLRMPALAGVAGQVFQTGEPFWIHDEESRQLIDVVSVTEAGPQLPLQWALYQAGLQSFVVLPLQSPVDTLGMLVLAWKRPLAYSSAHFPVLKQVADALALALERQHLLENEKLARRQAEALQETAVALNSTLNFDQLLELMLKNIGRVVPHDTATIALVTAGLAQIVGHRRNDAAGIATGKTTYFMIKDTPVLQKLMATGQPIIINDTQNSPDWKEQPETRWIRSYAGVPISRHGRVIGFLHLNSATPGTFKETHTEQLKIFAEQLSTAIENGRLVKAEQRARQVAEALRAANIALTQSLDLDTVLVKLYSHLSELVPYDCAVAMLGSNLPMLRNRFSYPPGYSLQELPAQLNQRILATQQSVIVSDARRLPEWGTAYGRTRMRSWMGIPLIAGGQAIGLYWLSKQEPGFFTVEQQQLAEALAAQAAVAIQNAQLYADLHHSMDAVQKAQAH